ncbi:2-keto-4-pentenoate hydratase [Nocardioides piscis]|uniref:2-keto-4-pentenoate hydratase n=1 Tax=Nocardioides piscis TaxID=2714938 RepID=UPI001FE54A30|nr:fumarylacetoacetate hydrolase family protein [Nocardioides piscis]
MRDLIGGNVHAAYAVQRAGVARRVAEGARITGRKVGLTSDAVQEQLGVDQPDFGVLLDDMAHANGAAVPIRAFLQPKVEAEIAFVLEHELAEGDLEIEQVRAAVAYAVAALEICDSRIADWNISFTDTVADNASSGAYVLGSDRRTLDEFDPRDVVMSMTVTDQEESAGTGAACMGDPLLALQWLARKARDLGEPLGAGQVILSGALGPMRPVTAGALVTASVTDLGSVSCTFTQEES